ncbi:hypothetical protein HY500_00945 [Candidatus Woesearchaeota archaeon]|nr:hypothetical protein [Candidatus Woesearchaeota archaeon]
MAKSKYDHTPQSYCGQTYVARVFDMLEIPDGKRMPDLISRPHRFDPKLLLEVKTSGRGKKASLNDFQLHYSVKTRRAYFLMFGEMPTGLGESMLSGDPSTTYYDCLCRTDDLNNGNLEKPFHDLMFTFGNHYIVPGEFAFHAFAFEAARKKGEPIRERIEWLKGIVKSSIYAGYGGRVKEGREAWQDIHFRDISAIFHRDLSLTTPGGIKRIEVISEVYPLMRSWKRVKIPGPSGTTIYILAKPEHERSFDVLLREDVGRRKDVLEQLIEERREAAGVINTISIPQQGDLFEAYSSSSIQDSDWGNFLNSNRERLKRLSLWLTEEESKK